MNKQMKLVEAHELYEDTGLPEGFGLRVVGGRTIYKYIGWMWRPSEQTIYLTHLDLFHKDEEKKRRYLPDDCMVELVEIKTEEKAVNNIKTPFANMLGWSDIEPFEVVRVISDKTIEVREMDAERDESVKMQYVAGGFSAICTNDHEQKWNIKSNPANPVIRIRLSVNKGWQDKHGRRFDLSDKPVKYYDHNF